MAKTHRLQAVCKQRQCDNADILVAEILSTQQTAQKPVVITRSLLITYYIGGLVNELLAVSESQ